MVKVKLDRQWLHVVVGSLGSKVIACRHGRRRRGASELQDAVPGVQRAMSRTSRHCRSKRDGRVLGGRIVAIMWRQPRERLGLDSGPTL